MAVNSPHCNANDVVRPGINSRKRNGGCKTSNIPGSISAVGSVDSTRTHSEYSRRVALTIKTKAAPKANGDKMASRIVAGANHTAVAEVRPAVAMASVCNERE